MQAQQAVGSGFSVLINALKTERGDVEMVRGILESLVLAVQPNERSARWQASLRREGPVHRRAALPCSHATVA